MLKATIGITLALIGYASYVYIGRLCVPMIVHNRGALAGGRATGSESITRLRMRERAYTARCSRLPGGVLRAAVDDAVGIRKGASPVRIRSRVQCIQIQTCRLS